VIGVAAALGYLIGSLPTADWLARAAGFDLRGQGSGNPGANNARTVGGTALGLRVLIVEVAKGAAAVAAGDWLAGDWGMATAGLGAVTGNILNPWYRLRGGQGLGIAGGVLAAAWPWYLPVALLAIGGVVRVTHSAARAALATLAITVVAALVWNDLPVGWGVAASPARTALAIGLAAAIAPKQVIGAIAPRSPGPR
jgi:glycerol-3-phosphate acyltransferase PlsY